MAQSPMESRNQGQPTVTASQGSPKDYFPTQQRRAALAETASTELPLVSAVVLSFNRKEETLTCLAVLKSQTYANLEIVVLDNGSKDGSADAVAREHADVLLFRMPINYGAWAGRDIAISNSHGKYVFQIDSDAEIDTSAVDELVKVLEANPRIGIVQPRIVDLHTGTTYDMGFGRQRTDNPFFRWQFHGCAALIRRDAYQDAGGYPRHYLVAGGGAYLSIPVLDCGYSIYYYPKVVVRHALSPKERIPKQRLLMSNLHRLQNNVTYNPYLVRVYLDLGWKLGIYCIAAIKHGYLLSLPKDVAVHLIEFIRTMICRRRPIATSTQDLVDHLNVHLVQTKGEYEKLEPTRMSLAGLLSARCRANSNREQPAVVSHSPVAGNGSEALFEDHTRES